MGLAENIGAGAIAGAAGALAMAGMLEAGEAMGVIPQPFPVTVEQRLARETGMADAVGQTGDTAVTWTEHLAIGSTWGALYGALRSSLGLSPLAGGALLGGTAYAVDMMGIGPALGLVRGPWNLQLDTVGKRMTAHMLYGVVTGLAYPKVQQFLGGDQSHSWAQQPPLPFAGRDWHTPTDAPAEWQPAEGRYGTVGAAAQAEASASQANRMETAGS